MQLLGYSIRLSTGAKCMPEFIEAVSDAQLIFIIATLLVHMAGFQGFGWLQD
jgi:hypothetical protein